MRGFHLVVMQMSFEQDACSSFRYLIPCSHLSRKQCRSLKQRDCYSSSAASFLLLMPSWCPVYLNSTHSLSEHIHWPEGEGQCGFTTWNMNKHLPGDRCVDRDSVCQIWPSLTALVSAEGQTSWWTLTTSITSWTPARPSLLPTG